MALPLFAATLFVSAFILFLVQPMIGKLILPKLGGTPQVWNTCMLFFQTVLLAGYAYTHTVGTRLTLRGQLLVHSILLFIPLIVLFAMGRPFNVDGFDAPGGSNPIVYTLLYLTTIVGLPFFVVSTSAPLLQKWFASTGHPAAKDPYFLYGASNLGSLLALLAYPFLFEPIFYLNAQAWIWASGYVVLLAMVLTCAVFILKTPGAFLLAAEPAVEPVPEMAVQPPVETATAIQPAPAPSVGRGKFRKKGRPLVAETPIAMPTPYVQPASQVVDWTRRLRWIGLSFVPSSLMLAVITFVSVDLSPFPLLWVAPLALYLLSFILVYLRWPTTWVEGPHRVITFMFPIFILGLAFICLGGAFRPVLTTMSAFLLFFGVALFCHGELARDRPSTRHLTEYYLCMSFGGMLGGVFNGFLSPIIFNWIAEFPIILVVACFMRPSAPEGGWLDGFLFKTFPNLEPWVRDRGDDLARTFGKAPRHSTYLLNITLDILLALFVLGLTYYVKARATATEDGWGWAFGHMYYAGLEGFKQNPLFRFWRAMGASTESAASWAAMTFNVLVYGVPILFCFFFAHRPIRFGLAVGAFLLVNLVLLERDRNTIFSGRSYFGVLRVFVENRGITERSIVEQLTPKGKTLEGLPGKYTSMMHGTTLHGQNYFEPAALGRLATTYYHRLGPVGVVMEKYNWFYGDQTARGTFLADNRMPCALVGMGASLGVGLPLDLLAHTWSEPPYATVGLGTGTMASYSRPFQHMTYYEIDQTVRNFSIPPDEDRFLRDGKPFFTYLQGALDRGVNLEVIMGDARQTMQKEMRQTANLFEHKGMTYGNIYPKRDKYYKVMVIDAFSSDAIPVHLLTYEAVKLYSEKLADDGVLCIHTSNRHLDLVKPVVDIATKLGLKYKYGDDRRDGETLGHTGSNYVMLAWDEKYLQFPSNEASPSQVYRQNKVEWVEPRATGRHLWTDDFSNIVSVIR